MSTPEHELTEIQRLSLLNDPNKAARFNGGKVDLSYIFDAPNAMEGLCSRFEIGAKKYSRDNWKKGLDENEIIAAMLRHLKEYKKGNYVDDKDGGFHVDGVVWNAVVLSEQFHRNRLAQENNNAARTENPLHRFGNCS
jgi:hypothetical protein